MIKRRKSVDQPRKAEPVERRKSFDRSSFKRESSIRSENVEPFVTEKSFRRDNVDLSIPMKREELFEDGDELEDDYDEFGSEEEKLLMGMKAVLGRG